MSSEVMHSALGTRHLRWLSAVRPRVRGEENRKSKIDVNGGMDGGRGHPRA